jgi:hypothetical protein
MATLTAPETSGGFGPRISELAPKGTYLATIVDILDRFGVERPKYEDPTVMEKLDLTLFVFGFKGKDGNITGVSTNLTARALGAPGFAVTPEADDAERPVLADQPALRGKVRLLGALDDAENPEIPDPIGKDRAFYLAVRDRIVACVDLALDQLSPAS